MRVIHHKKTKGTKTEVTINLDVSLDPRNIASYTKEKDGVLTHSHIGWMLPVAPDSEQYDGHRFELVIEAAELDRLEAFIAEAKKRFAENKVPGNVEATKVTVDVKEG